MKLYACLAASLLLFGCGAVSSLMLTQGNLDKVHNDMSPSAVKAILGDPNSSKTEAIPIVGGTQTTYTYTTKTSEVTIVFMNDLVQEKRGSFN